MYYGELLRAAFLQECKFICTDKITKMEAPAGTTFTNRVHNFFETIY